MNKLGSYKFIGHYDNIVRGVLNGDFEASVLKDTKAFVWHKKVIKSLSKKYTGFAPTSDKEYDVIRELIKPFNK